MHAGSAAHAHIDEQDKRADLERDADTMQTASQADTVCDKPADAATGDTKPEGGSQRCAGDGTFFFTTPTCPMCRMLKAKHVLDGIELTEVDAADPENGDLVSSLEIMTAPTLVVIKDGAVSKYANASEIMEYANSRN